MRASLLRKATNYWLILSGDRRPLLLAHLRAKYRINLPVQVLPVPERAVPHVFRVSQSLGLLNAKPTLPRMAVGEKLISLRVRLP